MKFFSFNRNHIAVMITLFFVIFFGAIYFFIYIPGNERRVQEQRFRTLQHVDRNIHVNIENSIALMNNLLGAYHNRKGDNNNAGIGADTLTRKYIRSFPKENFTLSMPEGPLKSAPDKPIDAGNDIRVDNNKREIFLEVRRAFERGDSGIYRMTMRFSFDQFSRTLLPENVFDQYVVFSNGQVAYETFPSGITYVKDSLLGRKNGIATATVRNLTVSGVDYKLFLQPVTLTADSVWVIGGLLSNKHYQLEKNQLPSNVILLLTIAALIIIVAFPWIKLYQMGSKDRLTVGDGIWTIVVAMLLMSLLFFTFFKYNTVFRTSDKDPKDQLAAQVMSSFEREIDSARATLYQLDQKVAANSIPFRDSLIKDSVLPRRINQIFWLRKDGRESANWLTDTVRAPHGNFKDRNYFKNVIDNNLYQRNGAAGAFFLDQVVSWNTGVFTSVLSIPSRVDKQAVAAMSFNINSLKDATLPAGYQFAIIDETGQVRYHSNAKRNLRENIVEEFSTAEKLISNIQARTSDKFRTRYFSKDYYVLIRPIAGLPYYVVILEDIGYKETRDMEIFTFTFCMMLLLFGFLMFQLVAVFLASSRNSFFRKQLYDTSWVGPKISAHHEYNLAILFNTVVIIMAVIFFHRSTFLTYLFILLFSVTMLAGFLNVLLKRKYRDSGKMENKRFKLKGLFSLIAFVVIIDCIAGIILDCDNLGFLFLYEVIVLAISIALYYKGGLIIDRLHNTAFKRALLPKWNYTHSFTLMALTRLIVTSGIPVAFFYISSFNFEQNISIRYRQMQYAKELLRKQNSNLNAAPISRGSFSNNNYTDGSWIRETGISDKVAPDQYSDEEKITTRILRYFHVYLTDQSVREDKFYAFGAADSAFFYNPLLKIACRGENNTTTYVSTGRPNQYLTLSAAPSNYQIPPFSFRLNRGLPGALFYLLLLLAIVLFYFVIYNIINKIFCFKLPDLSLWKDLDERMLSDKRVNGLMFIIGLPGSGKLLPIKKKIRNGEISLGGTPLILEEQDPEKSNVYIADLINIPDSGDIGDDNEDWKTFMKNVDNTNNKLIIVNHFEYNIQDPITNRIKLNFLEDLMLDNKCQIIILSTVHPVAFLDSVMDQSRQAPDQSIPGQDLERWHVLLGHYRIVVFPLEQTLIENDDPSLASIYKETEHTHYLGRLQESVVEVAKTIPREARALKGDELAFKLQVTSHYFYMYIWQSLTKEEKFLLYDLAEDNLVNSYDDYNLNMLLAKGVIKRPDGTLKLFNKGFRNFILTAIGNSEAMKIKNHIRDDGNWNKLKTPMLIVILAILTFLFASQEEAYSKLITYVAALAAGVPTVMKLISLFDKSGEKKS